MKNSEDFSNVPHRKYGLYFKELFQNKDAEKLDIFYPKS